METRLPPILIRRLESRRVSFFFKILKKRSDWLKTAYFSPQDLCVSSKSDFSKSQNKQNGGADFWNSWHHNQENRWRLYNQNQTVGSNQTRHKRSWCFGNPSYFVWKKFPLFKFQFLPFIPSFHLVKQKRFFWFLGASIKTPYISQIPYARPIRQGGKIFKMVAVKHSFAFVFAQIKT